MASLSGLSGIDASDYTSIISQNSSQSVSDKISSATSDDATDTEMLEACQEFEKYMIEQIYKSMENTIDRAEEKSDYEEYFGDMMVQEYAQKVEDQGGLGLAQQLYESMKRNEGDITLS
jgi:flagellar protein FlgJ